MDYVLAQTLPQLKLTDNFPDSSTQKLVVKYFRKIRRDPTVLIPLSAQMVRALMVSIFEQEGYPLRFVSDRIPELRKLPGGGQRSIRCAAGVIITGEFPMTASSDLTRCVIIDVDHQMYGREEDDHTVTCAVISRFLQYVSENYEACRKKIGDALGPFRADEGTDSAPRQQQHLAELSCAFQMLLECDSDRFDGFVDRKKGQIYLRLNSLSQLLTALSGRAWTEQAVGTLLRENGLVEVGRENHTAKAKLPGIGRFVPLNRNQLHRQAEVRK